MTSLWGKKQEEDFFTEALAKFASPESLFYVTKDKKYYAYWPKSYTGTKTTLQSRNSLIGQYTEKYSTELFKEIAEKAGGYSLQNVICDEIGLTNMSPADVAICKTKVIIQKPQNILLIIEVKMSVVWNWQFISKKKIVCIGDYNTHQGNPGLLRSDTMLKAIGKSINIRVSSFSASRIPIIIVGNTPITKSYYQKVDHLRKNGIIQGFWSVNPNPLDKPDEENIKNTHQSGFYRFDSYEELKTHAIDLLKEDRDFFSSMQTKKRLGELIEIANREKTYEAKAQRFLELLKEN